MRMRDYIYCLPQLSISSYAYVCSVLCVVYVCGVLCVVCVCEVCGVVLVGVGGVCVCIAYVHGLCAFVCMYTCVQLVCNCFSYL